MGIGVALGMDSQLRNVRGSASALALAGVPTVPRYGGSSLRGSQAGRPVIVNVTVQGNVTAEDDLKLSIVRAVSEGIVEGTQQRNRAMGVT